MVPTYHPLGCCVLGFSELPLVLPTDDPPFRIYTQHRSRVVYASQVVQYESLAPSDRSYELDVKKDIKPSIDKAVGRGPDSWKNEPVDRNGRSLRDQAWKPFDGFCEDIHGVTANGGQYFRRG